MYKRQGLQYQKTCLVHAPICTFAGLAEMLLYEGGEVHTLGDVFVLHEIEDDLGLCRVEIEAGIPRLVVAFAATILIASCKPGSKTNNRSEGKPVITVTLEDVYKRKNRGLEFENVTFRHLGIEEGKDQVKGVDYLKSLPYIDSNRIGVHRCV